MALGQSLCLVCKRDEAKRAYKEWKSNPSAENKSSHQLLKRRVMDVLCKHRRVSTWTGRSGDAGSSRGGIGQIRYI